MADKDEKDKDECRKALAAAAEDKDEKKAARAKRALKAYDESEDKEAADDKEPPKDNKEDDKDKAAVTGASVSAIASLETSLRAERERTARLEARLDAADRAAFLATRPDLSPELLKSLEGMKIEQVKAVVNAIPRSGFKSQVPTPEREPVRGETAGNATAVRPNTELDERMGLVEHSKATVYNPSTGEFSVGVSLPKKAAAQ